MAFQDFSCVAFAGNAFFQKFWCDFLTTTAFLASWWWWAHDGQKRLVCRDSDSFYNTTDLSLILLKQPLSSKASWLASLCICWPGTMLAHWYIHVYARLCTLHIPMHIAFLLLARAFAHILVLSWIICALFITNLDEREFMHCHTELYLKHNFDQVSPIPDFYLMCSQLAVSTVLNLLSQILELAVPRV